MGPTFLPEDFRCSYLPLPQGDSVHEVDTQSKISFSGPFYDLLSGERTELEKWNQKKKNGNSLFI